MKINESMRQFIIDRAENLYYDGLLFPKVRRATINWICLALRLARQAGDEDLYRQICSVCNENVSSLGIDESYCSTAVGLHGTARLHRKGV